MHHIEKSAEIPATKSTVFDFLTDRQNAPSVVPNLNRVWDIQPPKAGVGQRWKFEFKMLGMAMQGDAEMVEFNAGELCRFTTKGMIKSTWTYRVSGTSTDRSNVTVSVDYELPDTLWAKLGDRLAFSRINESQAEQLLMNLAAHFS